MRSFLAAVALTLAATSMATAALPPHYQRQAELVAILQSDDVIEAFGIGQPVEGLRLIETDLYEVRGGKCRMEVRIIDVPRTDVEPGFVGPRNFKVEAGELTCD